MATGYVIYYVIELVVGVAWCRAMQGAASSVSTAGTGSPVASSVQGAPAPAASRRRSGRTGVASPGRAVELRELQSRRRELTGLLTGALRENEVLRAQVDRSAAALDASGDGSETSQALRRHADTVRRLHDDMRANLARYRSTERTLIKKEAARHVH